MTGTYMVVAILPSLEEPDTIVAVTRAVDLALDDENSLIVHADASSTPVTADAFRATPTRARRLCLPGLPQGKGIQVRRALEYLDKPVRVLLADTDTRNPDPVTYRALLDALDGGAEMAVADYRRYWDEANLTNHLARPLIAVTTGYDVPQPLAGDIALSACAIAAVPDRYTSLPPEVAGCADGYGIDALLLQAAASCGHGGGGRVISVRLTTTKCHAPSFPHLPAIFAQAVPVLLQPAVHAQPQPALFGAGAFRLTDRALSRHRLAQMTARLDDLSPPEHRYDGLTWPQAMVAAWRAVADGVPAVTVAQRLWPVYLCRVRVWLEHGATSSLAQRSAALRTAANEMITALTTRRTFP